MCFYENKNYEYLNRVILRIEKIPKNQLTPHLKRVYDSALDAKSAYEDWIKIYEKEQKLSKVTGTAFGIFLDALTDFQTQLDYDS